MGMLCWKNAVTHCIFCIWIWKFVFVNTAQIGGFSQDCWLWPCFLSEVALETNLIICSFDTLVENQLSSGWLVLVRPSSSVVYLSCSRTAIAIVMGYKEVKYTVINNSTILATLQQKWCKNYCCGCTDSRGNALAFSAKNSDTATRRNHTFVAFLHELVVPKPLLPVLAHQVTQHMCMDDGNAYV